MRTIPKVYMHDCELTVEGVGSHNSKEYCKCTDCNNLRTRRDKIFKYTPLGFKLSNYWVNFLFYFTITTIGFSLYIFFGGDDKQFIPIRILSSMLWAKIFPIIKK